MQYNNGNTYDGDWVDDIIQGSGKFIYSNGDQYDGRWIRGQKMVRVL